MAPPAWHPDPFNRHELRWFDGNSWTAQVSDAGATSVDPYGTNPTPLQTQPQPQPPHQQPAHGYPTGAPATSAPPPKSNGRIVAVVIGIVAIAAVAVGAFVFLGGDDNSLAAEIDGIRVLLDDADPDVDDFQHLGQDCVVDVIDILEEAGVEVPDNAEAEEAAAFAATGFDRPFYDCYVALSGGLGYALDAVEIGDGVSADDLESLLDDVSADVDRVEDDLHDGVVIEACNDTEVLGIGGDTVDDTFCEYFWTFDGAGLAIIAAAHESLDMDGSDVLDVAVPEVLEALREAGEE